MRGVLGCVVASLLALPLGARGDGFIELAGSAGVAWPFGDVGNGVALSDFVHWAFPLEGRVAFRVVNHVTAGLYGRYSPVKIASSCEGCTIYDLGLGVLAEYRFGSQPQGGPWVGLSAGWQELHTKISGFGSTSVTGYEVAGSGGYGFEVWGVSVGPFGQLSVGEFTKSDSGGSTHSIPNKGTHGFLTAGVRLSVLL